MIPVPRLALALLLCLALVAGASADPWWNDSWEKRVPLTVTDASSTDGVQVQFNVTYDSDMQGDFDDLRFVQDDGSTTVDYWIESKSDSNYALCWLELPAGETRIYQYYGAPGAESESDGGAVFELFDHFDGASLDTTNNWIVTQSGGSNSVSDSKLTVGANNGVNWYEINSQATFPAPVTMEFYSTIQATSGPYQITVQGFGIDDNVNQNTFKSYQGTHLASAGDGSTRDETSIGSGHFGSLKRYTIKRTGTATEFYVAGSLVTTINQDTESSRPALIVVRDAERDVICDWVAVRKYAATEPTLSAGSEEIASAPPATAFTASTTTGLAPLTVQFTDTSAGSPTAWAWTFGDGETSTAQNPIHTYTEIGTYTVTLTATNAYGYNTSTQVDYITVYEPGPYYVATYADLCKVGTGTDGWTLDASYVQTADIQCPAGENFAPIGPSPGFPFTGTYDGQNYVIRGMSIVIDGRVTDFAGMFSVIQGASLTNIVLNDISVSATGEGSVGALVGSALTGSITNCHTTGSVEGANYVGGIAGMCLEPSDVPGEFKISKCTSSVRVVGSGYGGGVIGQLMSGSCSDTHASGDVSSETPGGLIGFNGGTVTRCSATGSVCDTGDVPGTGHSGGLIGYNWGGHVSESYATGDVTGNAYVGGFSGTSGRISDCYSTGRVIMTGTHWAGGFVGDGPWEQRVVNCYSTGEIVVTNYDFQTDLDQGMPPSALHIGGFSPGGEPVSCFWDIETSNWGVPTDYAPGKTTAEMKTLATFADWDLATPTAYTDEAWFLVPGEDYPRLAWEGVPATPPTVTPTLTPTSTTPAPVHHAPALPYSEQRKDTMGFLLMCWGALPFVGVFCIVIFLVMNGAQRGSGGI